MAELDLTNGALILGLVLGTLMIVCASFVFVVERRLERAGLVLIVLGAAVMVMSVWSGAQLALGKMAMQTNVHAREVISQASEETTSHLKSVQQQLTKLTEQVVTLTDKSEQTKGTMSTLDNQVKMQSQSLVNRLKKLEGMSKSTYREMRAAIKSNLSQKLKVSNSAATELVEQQSQLFAQKIIKLEGSLQTAVDRIRSLETKAPASVPIVQPKAEITTKSANEAQSTANQ